LLGLNAPNDRRVEVDSSSSKSGNSLAMTSRRETSNMAALILFLIQLQCVHSAIQELSALKANTLQTVTPALDHEQIATQVN
jgi:hypothetical protein